MIPSLAEPRFMPEVWRCSVLCKDRWQSIDIIQIQCGVLNPSYADLPPDIAMCRVKVSLLSRGFTMLPSGPQPQNSFLWLFWMTIAVLVLDSCYHLNLFLHSQFYWISFHSPYVLDVCPHFIHHFTSNQLYCCTTFDITDYFNLFSYGLIYSESLES